VSGVTFTGPNASDFSLTGIGCGSPYLCLIFIAFHPGAAGPRSGTAVIADTEPGSPHTVALTGQGTNGPIAKFSGKSLGFGSQAVGTNAAQPVNLTNTGTTMLHLSQVSASGDFSVDGSACGAQVPPGNQCSLSVTFSPGSPGHRTGGLTVVDDAFDSPQLIALDGDGIGAGPLLGLVGSVISASPTDLAQQAVEAQRDRRGGSRRYRDRWPGLRALGDRTTCFGLSDHHDLVRKEVTSSFPKDSGSSARITKLQFSGSLINRCLTSQLKVQIDPGCHEFLCCNPHHQPG
jgi:hypothetical protein